MIYKQINLPLSVVSSLLRFLRAIANSLDEDFCGDPLDSGCSNCSIS